MMHPLATHLVGHDHRHRAEGVAERRERRHAVYAVLLLHGDGDSHLLAVCSHHADYGLLDYPGSLSFSSKPSASSRDAVAASSLSSLLVEAVRSVGADDGRARLGSAVEEICWQWLRWGFAGCRRFYCWGHRECMIWNIFLSTCMYGAVYGLRFASTFYSR